MLTVTVKLSPTFTCAGALTVTDIGDAASTPMLIAN
jgi:hypothetical protein